MRKLLLPLVLLYVTVAQGQNVMTPETLLSLKRVSPKGMNSNGSLLYYTLYTPDLSRNTSDAENRIVDLSNRRESSPEALQGASIQQILSDGRLLVVKDDELRITSSHGETESVLLKGVGKKTNFKLSPDFQKIAYSEEIKYQLIEGKDIHDDLPKSELYIYDDLNYRHWDTWYDGHVSHVYVADVGPEGIQNIRDILKGEAYDCPQKPFGGAEDFVWDPQSEHIIYVCKKSTGRKYAESTNTDLYTYNISTRKTDNLTEGMMGYDTNPVFSSDGKRVAWLSMKRDGYESDKNDVIVYDIVSGNRSNLTKDWDGTAHSFTWGPNDRMIYFTAPVDGTEQIFQVNLAGADIYQVTQGAHDIRSIIGFQDGNIIVSKQSMNQATELYAYASSTRVFTPITQANTQTYAQLDLSTIEKREINTVDGKKMLVWVIYPPNFDPTKKYPTLLYCQGGPQAQVSQFYSFRWNFQLMAAQGYIVLAPNRRGLPGFGVAWNEQISQDWGGLAMQDYMQTTDVLSEEIPAIDKDRIGAVGASYGGYSVYMLAGIHQNRYKTFIAHCGLFDLKSWYGTTEELWFANWDLGGSYYKDSIPESYRKFSPSDYAKNWNTPMLIFQGGRDYRVPIGQGLQAYQAAKVRGLKSRLVYLPNENHWVLQQQNALAWQREFYRWLEETL